MAGLANTFDGAFDDSENDRSDPSSQEQTTTMIGSAANLMMPGLLHGAPGMEHILGGSVLGPPEAFYPFKSIDANGMLLDDAEEDDDDDDDDPEDMLNLQDFIDFGDDSDGVDHMLDDSDSTLLAKPLTDTPSKTPGMSVQHSSSIDLIQHFDKGVVASFRRNQTRHQSLLRRPSATYGIKGGRQFAANRPINPSKKRQASRSLSSTFSPFNGVTARRKVANKSHMRTRSAL